MPNYKGNWGKKNIEKEVENMSEDLHKKRFQDHARAADEMSKEAAAQGKNVEAREHATMAQKMREEAHKIDLKQYPRPTPTVKQK